MNYIDALMRCFVLLFAVVSAPLSLLSAVGVGDLTVERLVRPLGIEISEPRLSWIITSDKQGVVQTAYHVLVATSPDGLVPG